MTALDIIVLHGATGTSPDETDTLHTAQAIHDALVRLGHKVRLAHVSGNSVLQPWTEAERPDLVFNMVEAIDGDMSRAVEVPQMLEALGMRFTGCRTAAHLATATKTGQKQVMVAHGLPTPEWARRDTDLGHVDRVIVKSDTEHASIGMDAGSVVPGARAAQEIARREAQYGGTFFAETYINGREFNLSLIASTDGLELLPPAEILFIGYGDDAPRIVDYAAKWETGSYGYHNTPRQFDFPAGDCDLLARLEALARQAWRVFMLSGYARVDFRVDAKGGIWLLEVNTNPCLAPDAGFAAAAAQAGISYDTLIARIVATAMAT